MSSGFIVTLTACQLFWTDLESGPELKKKFHEHEIFPAHVKMPTIVGILTSMGRKNSILGLSEPEKC